VHVPYRGATPLLTDMLGGQVHVAFPDMPSTIEYVKAGKLLALAVTTALRSQVLPDIPTVGESVPGYEATNWNGIGAPRDTPVAIIETLNNEINAGLADSRMKERFAALGASPFPISPPAFAIFIAEETDKWGKVVKITGARPE